MGWETDQDFAATRPPKHAPIRHELAPGEQVAWAGQPRVGHQVLRSLPMLLFGLPFTALPCFAIGVARDLEPEGAGIVMVIFSLPFLLVGLGLLGSPAWIAWKASRTHYAITDRRAILCEPQLASGLQVRSYAPGSLGNIIRNQRADGSGDLIFEEIQTRDHKGHARTTRRGFFGVADVRGVENLIRATLLADRAVS